MKTERSYMECYKTNYKKITEKEMEKALHMYLLLNPFIWAIIIGAFILGTFLK